MKLGYVIVYVESVENTLSFYERAFGFQRRFLHDSKQYGELSSGETTIAFASYEMGDLNLNGRYQRLSADTPPVGIELAFVTEDVDSAFQKSVEAGAISVAPPISKPWGQKVAYVRSREGTLIEICSPIGG